MKSGKLPQARQVVVYSQDSGGRRQSARNMDFMPAAQCTSFTACKRPSGPVRKDRRDLGRRFLAHPSPRTSKASARRLSSSPVTPTRRRKSIKHPSNKDLYEQKKQTRYAELVYRQEEKKAAKGASAQYIEDKIKEIKASGRWGKSWVCNVSLVAYNLIALITMIN